eukprot:12900374-Prorocentrum_lima.AAC.1
MLVASHRPFTRALIARVLCFTNAEGQYFRGPLPRFPLRGMWTFSPPTFLPRPPLFFPSLRGHTRLA